MSQGTDLTTTVLRSSRTGEASPRTAGRRNLAPALWYAGHVLAVVTVLTLMPQTTQAAPAPSSIGVVDFYAITPVEDVTGLIPEQAAADDFSAMLAHAGDPQYTVIPRETMLRAEAELRWRGQDILHFDRLQALAHLVHADRLVVGQIQSLAVNGEGNDFPHTRNGQLLTGFASVVVQVFDASQGRIVAETRGTGYSEGVVRLRVTEQVLDFALRPLVRSLLLVPPAPAP